MSNLDYIKDAFIQGIHNSRDNGGPRDPRRPDKLWARDLGNQCLRKLWFETNQPELALPIDTETASKFILGDTVEVLVKSILENGGVKVHSEQERVEMDYGSFVMSGRIDFMVDDTIIEVKSINEWGYRRIVQRGSYVDKNYNKDLQPHMWDPYGYMHQLSFYMNCMPGKTGMLVLFNKSTGETWFEEAYSRSLMSLLTDEYAPFDSKYIEVRAKTLYDAASLPDSKLIKPMPLTNYGPNKGLTQPCTFCPFKFTCYPKLRVFSYADKDVYLTDVHKPPRVQEVTHEYHALLNV